MFESAVLFGLLPLPIVFAPDRFSLKFVKHMQILFFRYRVKRTRTYAPLALNPCPEWGVPNVAPKYPVAS